MADPSGSGTFSAVPSAHPGRVAREGTCEPKQDRRWIDPGRAGAAACGFPDGAARAAADINHPVVLRHLGKVHREAGVRPPDDQKDQPEDRTRDAREAGVVGVVVDRQYLLKQP